MKKVIFIIFMIVGKLPCPKYRIIVNGKRSHPKFVKNNNPDSPILYLYAKIAKPKTYLEKPVLIRSYPIVGLLYK